MKKKLLLFLVAGIGLGSLAGCENLDDYDRSYGITYTDASGSSLATSVRLSPRRPYAPSSTLGDKR